MDDHTYYFLLGAEADMTRGRRNTQAGSVDREADDRDADAWTPAPAVEVVAF